MKQLLLRKGKVSVEEVPAPALNPANVLVEVAYSLISTGTEISSISHSGSSLVSKAKQHPEELKKVLHSIKVRGIKKTFELVQTRLEEFKPLGYSCSGVVIGVGANVKSVKVGDRVACAGAGLANHAEVVSVPENLVVKIPTGVADKDASFVTLGAIALQGVRRADVRLGETACVIGLGLIGQLTVQLLNSAGCRVIGIDTDPTRVDQAMKVGLAFGTTDAAKLKDEIHLRTQGMGADVTLLTASTSSSDPTRMAFELTRKKGKIVVVGAVGMDLARSPFYEKEQDFLISCSYGPGRYDNDYEVNGRDYPYAFVRWTENRNMAAFLELIENGKMKVADLIEHVFPVQDSFKAYEILAREGRKPLAVVLSYGTQNGVAEKRKASVGTLELPKTNSKIKLGLIGFGGFTKGVHVPNLTALSNQVEIAAVCTATSASSTNASRQLKIPIATTDVQEILKNDSINAVLISTRHNQHAKMAAEALARGKHVFLEKPLALTLEELKAVEEALTSKNPVPVFVVGFNRRYAPAAGKLKQAIDRRASPLVIQYRVNAGSLPPGNWANEEEGGGRLRGEACHMIDFFQSLTGSPIQSMAVTGVSAAKAWRPDENFSAQFNYQDGSIATLTYTSLGNPSLPKEQVEVHWDGKSAILTDFESLTVHGAPEYNWSGVQDKGHKQILELFFQSIKQGKSLPVSWNDLSETTRACIALDDEVWGRIH